MTYPIIPVDPASADATEHLGTKPKYWYVDATGDRRLFKAEDRGTGEDWAEKVSCELARLLGIPHVDYDLAVEIGTGTPGVTCRNCAPAPRSLVLGNQLLFGRDPNYPADGTRYRVRAHSVGAVCDARATLGPPDSTGLPAGVETAQDVFIGYLMLDAWIANQDRHHENWGAIAENGTLQLAPTFDHGAALARNLTDAERERRLTTRDKRQGITAFARRAQSAFYSGPERSKPLKTADAWRAFGDRSPAATVRWLDRLRGVPQAAIDAVLDEVPRGRMSDVSKRFSRALLIENQRRLLAGDGA